MISAVEVVDRLPREVDGWLRAGTELSGDGLVVPWRRAGLDALVRLDRALVCQGDVPATLAASMVPPQRAAWPQWHDPSLVITSGVPRSGTSWLDRIARALVRSTGTTLSSGRFQGGRDDDFPTNTPGDPEEERLRAFVATGRDGHCLKTHFLTEVGSGPMLYAWRDLRDVVLSTCWYALAGPAASAFSGLDQQEAFARVTAMVLPPATRSLRAAAAAGPNVLLVRYSALVTEPEAQIRRVASHLKISLPAGFDEAAARAVSFRRESGREIGDEDRSSYHRKGVVGGWRGSLPAKQLAAIDAAVPGLEGLMEELDRRSR